MNVTRLGPGAEAVVAEFLRAHLDSSAILASNIARAGLGYSGKTFEAEYFGVMEPALVALVGHAWNGMVVLQAPVHAGALVRHALAATGRAVAGLLGPWAQVEVAAALPELAPRAVRISEREVLMSLPVEELVVPAPRGVVRPPRAEELPQIARFRSEFAVEALNAPSTPETFATALRELEAFHARGDAFVLEVEGRLVATGTFNARLPDLVQFGSIYTPPPERNRGYARALVAGAMTNLPGLRRAVLFTKNPAAERAYASIGFRVTGDYGLVLFA